jgi:hypothetical protein
MKYYGRNDFQDLERGRGRRCQLVAEKATGGEELLRWLVRDDEALMGALRRESASGANEV